MDDFVKATDGNMSPDIGGNLHLLEIITECLHLFTNIFHILDSSCEAICSSVTDDEQSLIEDEGM